MGMKRFYGVIRGTTEGATQFINDLNAAVLSAEVKEGTITASFTGSVGLLSSYIESEATEAARTASYSQQAAMAALMATGEVDEVLSDAGQNVVFKELTQTAADAGSNDAVIRLASNLFMLVRPYNPEGGEPIGRIIIKHIYQDESSETAHVTNFDIGSPNSNNAACAIAYEITAAKSGDALVKLAWCKPHEVSGTESYLKGVMSAQSINCYTARRDGNTHIIMKHDGSAHSEYIYGAKGPIGGFLLHQMATSRSVDGHYSSWGITIFHSDGTPLYTWTANSRPWDLAGDGGTPTAVNLKGLGRIIEPPDDDGYSPVKMTVLAPVMTPAVNDCARYARWMQQGIHDYSYFDDSGHIHLIGPDGQTGSAFFMDHGIALFDGYTSNFVKSNRETPLWTGSDLINVKRPVIDQRISYADELIGYYDSEAGLSAGGWMNINSDSYDITFQGSPQVLTDATTGRKFVRMGLNPYGWDYGTATVYIKAQDKSQQVESERRTLLLIVGRTAFSPETSFYRICNAGVFGTPARYSQFTGQNSDAGHMYFATANFANNTNYMFGECMQYNRGGQQIATGVSHSPSTPPANDGTVMFIAVIESYVSKTIENATKAFIVYDYPFTSSDHQWLATYQAYRNYRIGNGLKSTGDEFEAVLALNCMIDNNNGTCTPRKQLRTVSGASDAALVHSEAYGYNGVSPFLSNEYFFVGYGTDADLTANKVQAMVSDLRTRFFINNSTDIPTLPL